MVDDTEFFSHDDFKSISESNVLLTGAPIQQPNVREHKQDGKSSIKTQWVRPVAARTEKVHARKRELWLPNILFVGAMHAAALAVAMLYPFRWEAAVLMFLEYEIGMFGWVCKRRATAKFVLADFSNRFFQNHDGISPSLVSSSLQSSCTFTPSTCSYGHPWLSRIGQVVGAAAPSPPPLHRYGARSV